MAACPGAKSTGNINGTIVKFSDKEHLIVDVGLLYDPIMSNSFNVNFFKGVCVAMNMRGASSAISR
jgi:hypothetical protein